MGGRSGAEVSAIGALGSLGSVADIIFVAVASCVVSEGAAGVCDAAGGGDCVVGTRSGKSAGGG